MAEETLFSKIVQGLIPADIVFQDERVTAFRDINPQAPIHVLIVGIALPNETGVKMYEKLRFKKIGQFEEIGIK